MYVKSESLVKATSIGAVVGLVAATLKDSYNNRVSDVNVKIAVGDLTKTAKADENGQLSLNISTLASGVFKISARLSSVSDIYNESRTTAKLYMQTKQYTIGCNGIKL
ncbi:hypothetical protein [Methanobrevibacter sp.]|uniref:hypothetical protein n=1 Tax=Methanobrevibacter sp. TaxID=66852 RepID=UPI00388DE419